MLQTLAQVGHLVFKKKKSFTAKNPKLCASGLRLEFSGCFSGWSSAVLMQLSWSWAPKPFAAFLWRSSDSAYMLPQFLSPNLPRSQPPPHLAGWVRSADWTAMVHCLSGNTNFSSTSHPFSKIMFVWALGNFYSSLEFGWIEKHVQKC